MPKYQVSFEVEAETIDAAAQVVADLMTRGEADENIISDIVTRDAASPILDFANPRATLIA